MLNFHTAYTSLPKIRCTFYAIIIRKQSLQERYPGGVAAFANHYYIQSNDHIAVCCDMKSDVGNTLLALHQCGLMQSEDFTTFDTIESEMWCSINPEMRERPFSVDTRVEWLEAQYWNGTVWVWYCQ
jgi:hypothetical protein